MQDALYGPTGFYRTSGAPGANFRTAAHVSPLWADAIAALALRIDAALDQPREMQVVDMGAGGGELLAGLAGRLPGRIRLTGIDIAPRPADLPESIDWLPVLTEDVTGLLIAVEWLDVVPLDVLELTDDGIFTVEVDGAGNERLGPAPTTENLQWSERWWPLTRVGGRGEIGLTRDTAWRTACDRVGAGHAIAIDYPAIPGIDGEGTLTGFRHGRMRRPVPDGGSDITAHVLFESLMAPDDVSLSQREALHDLGMLPGATSYDGDPQRYLAELSAAGEIAELTDPAGLGGFTWLVHAVGIDHVL